MAVTAYRLELDANRHSVIVKEYESQYVVEPLTKPAKVVELCDKLMRLKFLAEENVVMIAVDIKGDILGIFKVNQGTVDMAACNPREIFIRALLIGVSRIFVVYNHPSGDSNPSLYCDKGRIVGVLI